jgi:hypothetical protein
MTATSGSAPVSEAALALALLTQAAAVPEPVRNEERDGDHRLRLLYAIIATWDKPLDPSNETRHPGRQAALERGGRLTRFIFRRSSHGAGSQMQKLYLCFVI